MTKLLAISGNKLPLEIIEAILLLLPPKSVGQFKSVSKTWNSLISSPRFIKSHLHQNHQITTKLILVSYTKYLYSVNINELLPDEHLNSDDIPVNGKELSFPSPQIWWQEMLGSCNGLVLVRDVYLALFLVNPTTREVWKLPPCPVPGCDRYGLGYDSSTDDYKIVSIWFLDLEVEHDPDCADTIVSVYSLRSNSWRKLPNSPYYHARFDVDRGALLNQNFHWLANTRPAYSPAIVVFNFASEEFSEISFPGLIENEEDIYYTNLAVIGGKLGLYFKNGENNELWVMEKYGVDDSWTRVFHNKDLIRPLCLVEGSSRDIVIGDEIEVLVYNIDEKRYRDVRIVGGPKGFDIGDTYVETLESPKRIVTILKIQKSSSSETFEDKTSVSSDERYSMDPNTDDSDEVSVESRRRTGRDKAKWASSSSSTDGKLDKIISLLEKFNSTNEEIEKEKIRLKANESDREDLKVLLLNTSHLEGAEREGAEKLKVKILKRLGL